ncbi:DUF3284 domain-containing protein [Enterococcus saccharolyticus]|uniref:DUF3284 domain-containing protein n=1 Tax=Enterococcus saccharolyticus TaxID=41997 RepID=UPI0039E081B0
MFGLPVVLNAIMFIPFILAPVFFNKIIDSVLYDIDSATGRKVSVKQLNQFEYVKEFSKLNRAKIKIEKVVPNKAYHFRTSTTRNDFHVKYDIVSIDEHTCEVRYQETMESFGTMQKMNDMLFGIILGFFKKRQFKRMLTMIEESC